MLQFSIPPTGSSHAALAEWMLSLPATLDDLGVVVSTGRVVDFRAREFLRQEPEADTVLSFARSMGLAVGQLWDHLFAR